MPLELQLKAAQHSLLSLLKILFVLLFPILPEALWTSQARAVAEEARHDLGNIIVENKPGAGGNIGVDYVAKQAPDGKTIVMGALQHCR